jgi:hypothetical protein
MAGSWLPRVNSGGWSSETVDGDGIKGRFVQFDWFGRTLEVSFGSIAAHERQMAKWQREREAQQ